MPSRRSSATTCSVVGGALLLVGAALGGCGSAADPAPDADPSAAPSTAVTGRPTQRTKVEGTRVPPDLAAAFDRILDKRSDALLTDDAAGFESVLGSDEEFRVTQRGYFDNLTQLPLGSFAYTLDEASLVRTGDSYWVVVDVALQLDGFDTAAVHTPDRFRFSPGPSGRGFRLTSVRDDAWEKEHHVLNQPWDVEPIVVRKGAGVLGIFDRDSARYAKPVVSSVARGISDVQGVVPYREWSGSVVVYAPSTDDFVSTLEDVPGDDPDTLDGVTFTLPGSADDPATAATRVALNPSMLTASRLERDRLVRHELTHVAVGSHDDDAPLWLSEGLAEYVSVRPLAPDDRRLARQALVAAKAGELTRLPEDDDFNDDDVAEVNYALSWWVCESLAQVYGPQALWQVLDDLDRPGVDAGPEVKRLLGVSRARLAKRGAQLMVRTYDPVPTDPTAPPSTPADPGATDPTTGAETDRNTVAP